MALTENQVKKISLAYQANEGNAEGVAYWVNSGVNEATAASVFYAANASLQSLSGLALATKIFENLGLNAETHPGFNQEGLAYWGNLIDSGAVPKDQAGLVIANAVRDHLGLTDDTFTQHIEKIKDITPITPSGATFMLTDGVDYADAGKSTHDNVADTFKFTDASEKITATFAQLSKGDQLIDLSNADNDTLALSLDINNVKQTIGSKNGATLVNIEELDITSRGAKNITFDNTISAAGLKTIKIAGAFLNDKGNDGNGFTFSGNVLKTLTTIDASAITAGNVNIDAFKATQDLTITGPNFAASINGGSGNDTITGQGTINAGAGDDIITINGKSDVTGGDGKDTFDVQAGKVTITDLGAGTDIIKVAAGAEVTANVGSGTWTATADSTNDGILTLSLGSGAAVNLAELAGNEKVNLVVESGTGSATVTGLNATDLTSVGSGAQLNIIGSGVDEEGVTIDLSKASVHGSGSVSITGTAGEDIITTAATGSTTVDAGAGADTISLGAGKDTVVFSSKAADDANTITNFGADDVLQFKTTSQFDGLGTLDTSGALTSVGSSAVSITSTATTVYTGTFANLKANLQGDGGTSGKVVVAIATDSGNEGIYAITLANGSAATTVAKVGTLNEFDLGTLTMANFATIA